MKSSVIFSAALLIAGAILAGFAVLANNDAMIFLGLILIGLAFCVYFGKHVVKYLSTFAQSEPPNNAVHKDGINLCFVRTAEMSSPPNR